MAWEGRRRHRSLYRSDQSEYVDPTLVGWDWVTAFATGLKEIWSIDPTAKGQVLVAGGVKLFAADGKELRLTRLRPWRVATPSPQALCRHQGPHRDPRCQWQQSRYLAAFRCRCVDHRQCLGRRAHLRRRQQQQTDLSPQCRRWCGAEGFEPVRGQRNGLTIPGPYLDAEWRGAPRTSNPGKYKVNVFDREGALQMSAGPELKHSGFSGCCNPVPSPARRMATSSPPKRVFLHQGNERRQQAGVHRGAALRFQGAWFWRD